MWCHAEENLTLKQAAHSPPTHVASSGYWLPSLAACWAHTHGWCATPWGKTRRSLRNIKPVRYACGKTCLATRGSTPGGKTCFFSWRRKPLDATWVGGECAACLIRHSVTKCWQLCFSFNLKKHVPVNILCHITLNAKYLGSQPITASNSAWVGIMYTLAQSGDLGMGQRAQHDCVKIQCSVQCEGENEPWHGDYSCTRNAVLQDMTSTLCGIIVRKGKILCLQGASRIGRQEVFILINHVTS
jgi:hypothetical protein